MSAARFELRGWHVLMAMLAFFGVIIAVNIAFAVIAVESFPGEDVRRSYLQGLQYNQTLAERRAQAALGWRAEADLQQQADGVALQVVMLTREGAPVRGATLAGELEWPTAARLDRTLAFEPAGEGRYIAPLGELQRGRWRLRARAESAEGGALDFEAELIWPPPQ
jgi:nitrogen fixation protein FixH